MITTAKEEESSLAADETAFSPGIYMPREQFAVRVVLGVLALVYFCFLPEKTLLFNKVQLGAIVAAFLGFHLVWWLMYHARGQIGALGIRIAALVDMGASFTALLVDPYPLPPTGLFVIISALGNGMQHGMRIFLEQFVTILVLMVPFFFVRQYVLLGEMPYNLVFVWVFIAICIYYSYLLLQRIELLKKDAETMARQDPLTRLYNRNAFARVAGHLLSLRERNRLSMVLMFADLDNFKEVNDNLGHAFGDEVLLFFARLLTRLLRKSDVAARYGGDEFVFLLVGMSVNEAERVAHRLQDEFARWTAEQDIGVGVSFGIGEVPENPDSLDSLLQHVDAALYRAKEQGGNRNIVVAPPLE